MSTVVTFIVIIAILIVVAFVVHSENQSIVPKGENDERKDKNGGIVEDTGYGLLDKIRNRITGVGYENLEKYDNDKY